LGCSSIGGVTVWARWFILARGALCMFFRLGLSLSDVFYSMLVGGLLTIVISLARARWVRLPATHWSILSSPPSPVQNGRFVWCSVRAICYVGVRGAIRFLREVVCVGVTSVCASRLLVFFFGNPLGVGEEVSVGVVAVDRFGFVYGGLCMFVSARVR